jgi:hypothetical protein
VLQPPAAAAATAATTPATAAPAAPPNSVLAAVPSAAAAGPAQQHPAATPGALSCRRTLRCSRCLLCCHLLLLLHLQLLLVALHGAVGAVRAALCCCEQEVHKPLLKLRDLVNTREEVYVNHVAQRRRSIGVVCRLLVLPPGAVKHRLLLGDDQIKVEELHAQLLPQGGSQC